MIVQHNQNKYKLIFRRKLYGSDGAIYNDLVLDLSNKKTIPKTTCLLFRFNPQLNKYELCMQASVRKNPNDQGNLVLARRLAFDQLKSKLSVDYIQDFVSILEENYQKCFRQPKIYLSNKSPNE